jgi:hypothetical protein
MIKYGKIHSSLCLVSEWNLANSLLWIITRVFCSAFLPFFPRKFCGVAQCGGYPEKQLNQIWL